MLQQINVTVTGIEQHHKHQWLLDAHLNYLASEIMEALQIEDAEEIATSLNRAFLACRILQIPLHRNFKKIYCYDGKTMTADWKISSLACYLIVINCNPAHENVAKAQIYFALHPASSIKNNL